ncbi:Trk system potassium transporter TrkA [Planctomycetota bacterium]
MKIIIVGAGIVGSNLAEELSCEGHEIAIIDKNSEKIKKLSETLDVLAITGDAASPSVLRSADVASTEMLISVTDRDEVNIVVCMLAHKLGIKKRIARIRNEEYTNSKAVLDLHDLYITRAINPDQIIVDSITKIIETPGATYVEEFVEGEILLRGFDVPKDAPIAGKTLSELKDVMGVDAALIAGIYRGDQLIIPRGTDEIRVGDHIFVLVAKDTLPFFLPLVNKKVWGVRRVIIYGAGPQGVTLARKLEEKIDKVVVLEESEELAEEAAGKLNKAIVLKGKGTDVDLLNQADIREADYFIALSDDDENNLTSGLVARKCGAKRIVVLTHDPDYVPILDSIGMDVVINPRLITAGAILEYIRHGRVRKLVKLKEAAAEVMELVALTGSKVVGRPLKDVKMPSGALVGIVMKDTTPVIATGNTIIKPGERVIIFVLPEARKKIEALFER